MPTPMFLLIATLPAAGALAFVLQARGLARRGLNDPWAALRPFLVAVGVVLTLVMWVYDLAGNPT
jgi:hypothetical protein